MNKRFFCIGDLVHVKADGCDGGLGLVLEQDDDGVTHAFRVLTQDGRRLFYFRGELELASRANENETWYDSIIGWRRS